MSAIHKNTFAFLRELIGNNNRDWFMDNKARYEEARENVLDFTAALLPLMAKADPMVDATADPKKRVLRIYRDIRFSKDKTPYKTNFGIGIPSGHTGYFVQIQPGDSFAAGGYWMPEAGHLKAIRQEIDYNPGALLSVIDEKTFRKAFGDFRKQDKLKTVPRDYSADHEHIDLLKLKSFAAMHTLTDTELQKKDAENTVAGFLIMTTPLNTFLARAISS
ncbi:MAG: DUF2461 domain-containing protein [Mucilaginibacter polytrichastri]|nr:DUF2461 domain-containing protein [Mucilaginibacter polytrichastri]